MAKAPPPADLHAWTSYTYWRRSDARLKQYWYASFCLMMSALQDRMTGLHLRESGNLNWATTAFYYSAVHAGRLLCFLCAGDYPTGHTDMANLLAPGAVGGVKFDWLASFHSYLGAPGQGEQVTATSGNAGILRPCLERVVAAAFPASALAVSAFLPLPAQFKKLRNDCNYEAFLVAHERNHVWVTPGFTDLARSAERASEIAVDMAIALTAESLTTEPAFGVHRAQFIASQRYYVRGRLEHSLAEKFRASPAAIAALRTARDALLLPAAPDGLVDGIAVDAFLQEIEYGQFGQKQGLMQRWRNDVETLKTTVGL